MRKHPWPTWATLLLWAVLLGAGTGNALAQPDNQPTAPTPAAPENLTAGTLAPADAAASAAQPAIAASAAQGASAPGQEQARDALKKKAGDVDQNTNLKDALTKTERQYSLLKQGRIDAIYSFNYSYTGTQAINVGYSSGQTVDLFEVENTRAHTITNVFEVDYGLFNNVTLAATLPLVSKYTQSTAFSGETTDIGDITLGFRYQPFAMARSGPSTTLTGTLSLPTGRSPFQVLSGTNLSTGAGYTQATFGVNLSQVFDPVALFGSFSMTLASDATGIHQQAPDGTVLTKVHPGLGLGFGAGFTYALSYDITTTVSFTENVVSASHINYLDTSDNSQVEQTAMQVAAMLNFGLGVRLNPKTTVTLSTGIGLTSDSPNFSLTLQVPLNFPAL